MVLAHPEDEFHFFFDRPYDDQFVYADNVVPHVLSPPSRHPFLWYLWFEWAVARKLKSLDVDVFYSGDMFLSLRSSTPTVMVSHDLGYEHYPEHIPWLARKYYRHYFPKYHQAATRLISVSEATKKDITRQYKVPADRIIVAGNAVPAGFHPRSESEKEQIRKKHTSGNPYFLFVGSLHPRKNLDRLLLAFDKLKNGKLFPHKLVIYGEKFFKTGSIFKTYNKMDHKNEVIFLDNTDVDVPSITGAATALCYASLFEGFGIPILEAFASEIPVITSHVSAMPEVAGAAALFVDPLDSNSIMTAMQKIIAEPDLVLSLVKKGKERLPLFSWDESARMIYKELKNSGQQS